MTSNLTLSHASVRPRLELSCHEPTIRFGQADWSMAEMYDNEEDFSIIEAISEARAVRMVSPGRPVASWAIFSSIAN